MTTVQWPSELLPGPVAVSLDLPDDWTAEPAPNVCFVAASPNLVNGVQANIVVSVRRIDAGVALDEVIEMVGEQLVEIAGSHDRGLERADLAGVPAVLRRFRLDDSASGTAVELCQLVSIAPVTELVSDVVTATLTYSPNSAAAQVEEMEQSLLTLRLDSIVGVQAAV